jgi:hypothetical protein
MPGVDEVVPEEAAVFAEPLGVAVEHPVDEVEQVPIEIGKRIAWRGRVVPSHWRPSSKLFLLPNKLFVALAELRTGKTAFTRHWAAILLTMAGGRITLTQMPNTGKDG